MPLPTLLFRSAPNALGLFASKASFAIYAVLLLLAQLLLASPGNRVPIYVLMSIVTLIPIGFGNSKARAVATVLLVCAICLSLVDYRAGLRFRERVRLIREDAIGRAGSEKVSGSGDGKGTSLID